MSARFASVAAPVYLAACLLAGGSGQGVTNNFLLQLGGAAILAWSFAAPEQEKRPGVRYLAVIAMAALGWIAFQLLPLPSALWARIPGREFVVSGFDALRMALPAMPISLDPNATVRSMLALLPPAAMFVLARRSGLTTHIWSAGVLLAVALASIGLGVLQIGGGKDFYLYRFVNLGAATGFFANANHLGALLLTTIPFLAALAAGWIRRASAPYDRLVALAGSAALAAVLAVGVVVNGSLAVLLLGGPVIAASLLLLVPRDTLRLKRWWLLAALALTMISMAGATAAVSGLSSSAETSWQQRVNMWSRTAEAVEDHGLAGTGLGTFPVIYAMKEDPSQAGRFYVNHAHNDYLEIVLELGVPGALLLIAFLAWWLSRVAAVWAERAPVPLSRAATIASGALLAHSLVDFPLRTAALAAVFAMCLALLTIPAPNRKTAAGLNRPPRHVSIEQLA